MKKVIYLVECFDYEGIETTHYVSSAWENKEDAIKKANELLKTYEDEGWQRREGNKENMIGYVESKEETKFYWINEIELK